MENLNQETHLFENLLKSLKVSLEDQLLVVNCGYGERVQGLQDHGYKAIGIDQDFSKIRTAIELYPEAEFFQHDFENIFYINFFNGVFILEPSRVFRGTSSQRSYILKNILACLDKNGLLVLIFPDYQTRTTFHEGIEKDLANQEIFSFKNHSFGEVSIDSKILVMIKQE